MWITPIFDLRTTCLLAGLASIMASMMLTVMRGQHRRSRAAVQLFGWSLTAGGLAMLSMAAARQLPEPVGEWLGQLAGVSTFALMFEAVRRLCGAESRMSVVAACVGFLAILLALSPGAHVTASVGIFFEAACCAMAVLVLLRSADYLARDARWSLAGAMSAALVVNLVRLSVLWAPGQAGLVPVPGGLPAQQGLVAAMFTLLPMAVAFGVMSAIWTRREAQRLEHTWDDELTGTATRRFLFAVGEPWLAANERQHAHTAVLMIDVDGFKAINAEHGHDLGDKVLRHVADVLRRSLRSDSLISRFSNAEFCALVPVDEIGQARVVAERLCRVVEGARFHAGELTLTVTISIGVALYEGGATLQQVLHTVESRLDTAKREGRNCVVGTDAQADLVTGAD